MDAALWKNIVFNFIPNNVQGWLLYIGGFVLIYLWRKVGSSFVKNYIQAQKDKEHEKELKQEARIVAVEDKANNLEKYAIDAERAKLVSFRQNCYRKGYRTASDTHNFETVYHIYKALGGNSDGDDIRTDFLKIPFSTVTEIKERIGAENPSEENTQKVAEFVKWLKSGVVNDDDMSKITELITTK